MLELIKNPAPLDLDGLVFPSIEAALVDDAPKWEGDDSVHGPGGRRIRGAEGPAAEPASKLAAKRVVPFVRPLSYGMAGTDVTGVQRALSAEGTRKRRPSGWYGPVMRSNVKTFQRKYPGPPTGKYGKPTHERLSPFFDAYGVHLLHLALVRQGVEKKRAAIVAVAMFSLAHREAMHYSQGPQRMDGVRYRLTPPKFPARTDCSGFVCWGYRIGGGPDPCGFDWNLSEPHYTGSIAHAGRAVSTPNLGDLLLYGRGWPFEHTTVYVGGGKCVSQGSEPGPYLLPIHYRADLAEIRTFF